MSGKINFVRGVRPCIVALRENANDGNTFWEYLNTKSPRQLLCFSVFQADAIAVDSQGHAFLHFGFTSNHDGTISHHKFEVPKEITFDINSELIHKLVVNLSCPRSGSLLQNWIINDKSIQHMILSSDKLLRLLVSEETRATGSFKYNILNAINKIDVIDFKMIALYLKEFVTHFFDLNPNTNKIVIKNTTVNDAALAGCLILDRCGIATLPEKLEELKISPSDNVLVEEFISECLSDEHCLRAYSIRSGKKMNAAKKLQSATTLSPLLFKSPNTTGNIQADADTLHHHMHTIMQQYWDTILPHLKKVDKGAEPMVLGFDFALSPEGPVCTQVSSLDSLSQYNSIRCGFEPLYGMFHHILNCSYDYMLHDCTVILTGMSIYTKLQLFQYLLKCMGAYVVLLDEQPPPLWASGFIQQFIRTPLCDPSCYEEAAKEAARKLKELNVKPFSVLALTDDFVPFRAALTAILQQEQLMKSKKHSSTSAESALRNRDKIHVYRKIQKQEESSTFDPGQYSIAPNVIVLTDRNVSSPN